MADLREIVARALFREHLKGLDDVTDVTRQAEAYFWDEWVPEADAVLTALREAGALVEVTERYRHLKRGGEYEVISRNAKVQCDDPLLDGEDVVIYRDAKGRYWARHPEEFDDGRFEPLPPATGEAK
jgi:hypothetical protein